MKAPIHRNLRTRILLVIASFIISYSCFWFFENEFQTWNSRIVDQLFVFRSKAAPSDSLVDDNVIHVDANFYFSRSQHARVIRNLASMNVSAQLIDFIFAKKVSAEEDRPLIQAISEANNVFLGLSFENLETHYPKGGDRHKQESLELRDAIIGESVAKADLENFYIGLNPEIPYTEVALASRGLGYLNLPPDSDGILRRVPLLVRHQGALYPSIALRTVCDYLGVTADNVIVKPGKSILLKNAKLTEDLPPIDIVIPIDRKGAMIINYTGAWQRTNHYSYSEIFQASEIPGKLENLKRELSGKIAVVSETVGPQIRIRPFTVENDLPSGAIHTIIIQNILAESFLRRMTVLEMLSIDIILLAVVLLLSIRFSSLTLTTATLGLAAVFLSFGVLVFFYHNVIVQFIRPILMLSVALSFLLIAIGVEKALLHAETEKARKVAERELEIGREIQADFFPATLPELDGWELVTHFQAARHVSGDFYDVFTLGRDKKIGIVIADVCDKGVGAALFMALFRSFIRVLSGSAHSNGHLNIDSAEATPEGILRHTIRSINDYISITHEEAGMFATVFYGLLEPSTGKLYFINGGHEPPVVIIPGGIKTWLRPTGPAIGLQPNVDFDVNQITLAAGQTLFIYTDGVIDAQNSAGEIFSKNRLMKLLEGSSGSAQRLIIDLKTMIEAHIVDENQFDDITAMALRRKN